MSQPPPGGEDIAALAKGGRTNFFGFLLRLAARLPFLFVAGRYYGPEALGRFAYAILIVEFAAQLATLGLKRGLAEQLSSTDKPHVWVVWDAMLVAFLASARASCSHAASRTNRVICPMQPSCSTRPMNAVGITGGIASGKRSPRSRKRGFKRTTFASVPRAAVS